MKKIILNAIKVIVGLYVLACGFLYFYQENMIFFPQKLDKEYHFNFNQPSEEVNIETHDGISLSGLLFKANNSKGLIFYLHGNGGSIATEGYIAETFTLLNYDVFILDYRGYGKSEGEISSQNELYRDVQTAYNQLKESYKEENIVILGYSIGTGPATKLASTNNPKQLILHAPYFSLTDMMRHNYPIFPTFLLKYKFSSNEYIKDCKMPIAIFHGDKDRAIYYESSLKLKQFFKPGDTLIKLPGHGHRQITKHLIYNTEISGILGES